MSELATQRGLKLCHTCGHYLPVDLINAEGFIVSENQVCYEGKWVKVGTGGALIFKELLKGGYRSDRELIQALGKRYEGDCYSSGYILLKTWICKLRKSLTFVPWSHGVVIVNERGRGYMLIKESI